MIEFGHLSHVGLRRQLNEDSYYGDGELGLWLVADGMGGHACGEVASALARETIVREAFKDLLKAWGKQQGLVFLAEYPLKTATKTSISVDGALLHELRMPLGYWEAKDAQDKLDEEIAKKFRRGYPQDNIVFSDDASVVLWQHRQEVMRCAVEDTAALEKLLNPYKSITVHMLPAPPGLAQPPRLEWARTQREDSHARARHRWSRIHRLAHDFGATAGGTRCPGRR